MRFRADIINQRTFSSLISSLAPLAKIATLKLKADTVHLICAAEGNQVQVWSQIAVASIFDLDTFCLESNSNNEIYLESKSNNEIYLEISTEALSRALKSASGATSVTIKLAKKGGIGPNGTGKGARPVLSLEITSMSVGGRQMSILQDIGVKAKKQTTSRRSRSPCVQFRSDQVTILLPPLISLRTVADRLKTIPPVITISANCRGEFRLKAESDEATVETEWRGLKHPARGENHEASQGDPETLYSVSVDSKSLLKFLGSYAIATTTIACICEGHCAIFYVYIGDTKDSNTQGGVLTFFVPALVLDD